MQYQENLLLTFENITHNSAQLIIQWARTKAVVPFATDTKRIMENEIREKLANSPTGQTYYEIARYYQEEGIRLDEALSYLGKALQMNGETYYFYRVKALVEGDLGDYTAAIESAKKSIQLAEKENKDEFVRLNQKDIKVWQEVLKNN
jgi:tetratricopeptide (TPR) repeat protein